MAWSDAARRAALEARRRKVKGLVRKSADITKHPRSQVSARRSLLKMGRDPETGRKVGKRAAKKRFDYLADMSND